MMNPVVLIAGNSIGLILFGLTLHIAVRMLQQDPYMSHKGLLESAMSTAAGVLIVMGILGILFAAFAGFAVFVVVVGLVILWQAMFRRRVSQRYALLWMLTVSTERRIPLVAVFEAFSNEHMGSVSRKSRRAAAMLRAGLTLPEVLQKCRGLVPPDVLPILIVGYHSGTLAQALRRTVSTRDFHGSLWGMIAARSFYVLLVLSGCIFLISFTMLRIVPQFIMIFDDFEAELPDISRAMILGAYFFGTYGWWLVYPFYLVLSGFLLYTLLRYMGVIHFDVLGIRWLLRRTHTATILDSLSLAAQQKRPMLEGMVHLVQTFPQDWVKIRLSRAAADVQRGEPWGPSLAANGLLDAPSLAVLESAERVGNLPWAMQEMAESGRRRTIYRINSMVQTLFPFVVLAIGMLVAVYAIGMFYPLITLIDRTVYPG